MLTLPASDIPQLLAGATPADPYARPNDLWENESANQKIHVPNARGRSLLARFQANYLTRQVSQAATGDCGYGRTTASPPADRSNIPRLCSRMMVLVIQLDADGVYQLTVLKRRKRAHRRHCSLGTNCTGGRVQMSAERFRVRRRSTQFLVEMPPHQGCAKGEMTDATETGEDSSDRRGGLERRKLPRSPDAPSAEANAPPPGRRGDHQTAGSDLASRTTLAGAITCRRSARSLTAITTLRCIPCPCVQLAHLP